MLGDIYSKIVDILERLLNICMTKDERLSFRIEAELKDWVIEKGSSKFLRRLVIAAYEKLEKKKYYRAEEALI